MFSQIAIKELISSYCDTVLKTNPGPAVVDPSGNNV